MFTRFAGTSGGDVRRTRGKNSPGRCWFVEITQEEDGARFVFVDETSTNLTHARRYGRAPAGRRLNRALPLHSGPNGALVAAGLGALMSMDGAVNGDVFAVYLDPLLGPTLVPSDVVVRDNLLAHKGIGLAALETCGGRACATCRLTRRALIRLNGPAASSKRDCARPRPVPGRPGEPSFRPPPTG